MCGHCPAHKYMSNVEHKVYKSETLARWMVFLLTKEINEAKLRFGWCFTMRGGGEGGQREKVMCDSGNAILRMLQMP